MLVPVAAALSTTCSTIHILCKAKDFKENREAALIDISNSPTFSGWLKKEKPLVTIERTRIGKYVRYTDVKITAGSRSLARTRNTNLISLS